MTPLAQLVDAIIESADPALQIIDDVELAPGPDDARLTLGNLLAPLEHAYSSRDLLVATAVLESVVPLLTETISLVPQGRPV